MSKGIRVTVEDLETGETETVTFHNDWYLLTVGDRYLASSQHYANGTSVLTIKRDSSPEVNDATQLQSRRIGQGGES